MVSPNSRTMLTAALKPPLGMVFDTAVATTYTLDLALALMLPVLFSQGGVQKGSTEEDNAILRLQRLRSHADAISIFVQKGGIKVPRALKPSPAYSLLEPMIFQTTSPKEGIFHPKVILVRYKDGGSKHLRLIVMTRNLTFDKSWDVAVILDGEVRTEIKTTKNDVLSRFLEFLANTEGLPEKRRTLINSLRTDLTHVCFDPPEGYTQYGFHTPFSDGIDWRPRQKISRWGMISPFLKKEAIKELGEGLPEPRFVLSRDEELSRVGDVKNGKVLRDIADYTDGDGAIEQIQVSGLHAKCYLYDYTYKKLSYTRLVIGSANATNAALVNSSPRNVEFMVSLSGKRTKNGVDDFAEAMEPYWMPFNAENPVPADKKREEAQKQLEKYKRQLVEIGFQVDCGQAEDGLIEMVLKTQFGRKVPRFDGVREIRAFPVTQSSSAAQVLELPGKSWSLNKQRAESVTGLIAFEIHSSEEDLTECFVLNLPVNGLPADRDEQILASLIANPSAFVRFLAVLLQDDSSEGNGAVGAPVSPMAAILKSNGFGGMPLSDSLLKAYCRSPNILKEIARVIAAVDKGPVNVVPDDFRKLWAGFAPLVKDVK